MQEPEERWIQDGATQLGTHQDRQGEGGAAVRAGAGGIEEASDRDEGAGSRSPQRPGVCDANESWRGLRPTAGESVEAIFQSMWNATTASLFTAPLLPQSCLGDGEFTGGPGCSSWTFNKGAAGDLRKTNRQIEVASVAEGSWMIEVERKRKYCCRYCKQLVGCSERGVIGMYSMKILTRHEKTCADNISPKSIKSDIINCC